MTRARREFSNSVESRRPLTRIVDSPKLEGLVVKNNRRFTCDRIGETLSKTHFEVARVSDKPAALFHGLTVR